MDNKNINISLIPGNKLLINPLACHIFFSSYNFFFLLMSLMRPPKSLPVLVSPESSRCFSSSSSSVSLGPSSFLPPLRFSWLGTTLGGSMRMEGSHSPEGKRKEKGEMNEGV